MDRARSRQYLQALGITPWRLRMPERASEIQLCEPAEDAGPEAATPPPLPTAATPSAVKADVARASVDTRMSDDLPPPYDEIPPDIEPDTAAGDGGEALPDDGPSVQTATPVAKYDWPELQKAVRECRACRLCERRTNTVFGVGDQHADVMFVGEAPGQEEDLQGEPFVGRAGQLLNRMLAAVGLDRTRVYIANVVKCRPPNNRNPQVDEAAACQAFLARQIELVAPRFLVCLGGVSATNLLGTGESVGRLRGRIHHYGPRRTRVLVTYHPSYYLRSPAEKAKGWQDLQTLARLIDAPSDASDGAR